MNRPSNIYPLHRGPRLVVVRPHQPEPHRQVADLSEWLNRPKRSPLAEHLADIRAELVRSPDTHLIAALLGFIAGLAAIAVPALIITGGAF